MRHDLIRHLYDENDALKPEELRRLTPGNWEFALLDATIRAARARSGHPPRRLFQRLNPALDTAASAEPLNLSLSGLATSALDTLTAFFDLSPKGQRIILQDDHALEILLRDYRAMRECALTAPAPLPSDWRTLRPTCDDWEAILERDLRRSQSAASQQPAPPSPPRRPLHRRAKLAYRRYTR